MSPRKTNIIAYSITFLPSMSIILLELRARRNIPIVSTTLAILLLYGLSVRGNILVVRLRSYAVRPARM